MSKEEFLTIIDREIDRLQKEMQESERLANFYENIGNPDFEKEKHKATILKEQIKKMKEIINLPLYLKIQNVTDAEVEKYKKSKVEDIEKNIEIQNQHLSSLQKELDMLNSRRESILSEIRRGTADSTIYAQYNQVEQEIKEKLESIEEVRTSVFKREFEKNMYSNMDKKSLIEMLQSKLKGVDKMQKAIEPALSNGSQMGYVRNKELSHLSNVNLAESALSLAERSTNYYRDKNEYEKAVRKYIQNNHYNMNKAVSTFGLPEVISKYYNIPNYISYLSSSESYRGMEYYKNETFKRVEEAKSAFLNFKEFSSYYIDLLSSFPGIAKYPTVNHTADISKLEEIMKYPSIGTNDTLGHYISKDVESLKSIIKEKEKLQKKIIKTKRIKESIAYAESRIKRVQGKIYDTLRDSAANWLYSAKKYFDTYELKYDTSVLLFDEKSVGRTLDTIKKHIEKTEKGFKEIDDQIEAIESEMNSSIFSVKNQFESDKIGYLGRIGEPASSKIEPTYSNWSLDDNVKEVASTFGKFRQEEKAKEIEETINKEPSSHAFTPQEIDEMIKQRNARVVDESEEMKL